MDAKSSLFVCLAIGATLALAQGKSPKNFPTSTVTPMVVSEAGVVVGRYVGAGGDAQPNGGYESNLSSAALINYKGEPVAVRLLPKLGGNGLTWEPGQVFFPNTNCQGQAFTQVTKRSHTKLRAVAVALNGHWNAYITQSDTHPTVGLQSVLNEKGCSAYQNYPPAVVPVVEVVPLPAPPLYVR